MRKRLLCAPACQGTAACRSRIPPSSRQAAGRHPLGPRPALPRSRERRPAQPASMHRSPATAGAHKTLAHLALKRHACHAAMRARQRKQRQSAVRRRTLRTWDVTEDARRLAPRSARATLAQRRSRCIAGGGGATGLCTTAQPRAPRHAPHARARLRSPFLRQRFAHALPIAGGTANAPFNVPRRRY